MEDFERTNEVSIRQQISDGVAFVVSGHSYGRLDRLDLAELEGMARHVGELAQEVARLQDGLDIEITRRLCE